MQLKEWLIEKNITQSDFASALGVSRHYLCRVIAGRHVPSRKLALYIEKLTGREVSAVSMLGLRVRELPDITDKKR